MISGSPRFEKIRRLSTDKNWPTQFNQAERKIPITTEGAIRFRFLTANRGPKCSLRLCLSPSLPSSLVSRLRFGSTDRQPDESQRSPWNYPSSRPQVLRKPIHAAIARRLPDSWNQAIPDFFLVITVGRQIGCKEFFLVQ
jgi:hypothetical protein